MLFGLCVACSALCAQCAVDYSTPVAPGSLEGTGGGCLGGINYPVLVCGGEGNRAQWDVVGGRGEGQSTSRGPSDSRSPYRRKKIYKVIDGAASIWCGIETAFMQQDGAGRQLIDNTNNSVTRSNYGNSQLSTL